MKNFFNLGFIVLILVVLGCNCSKLDEFTKSGRDSSPPPTATPTDSTPPVTVTKTTPNNAGPAITKEKADQIKKWDEPCRR